MQIPREEVYISNKFPPMSYVFLYVKSHNFPPNGQISREGASQIEIPHFFQPWSADILRRIYRAIHTENLTIRIAKVQVDSCVNLNYEE